MKSPRTSSRASGQPTRRKSVTRRAAVLRVRESEARLRLALEAAQVGIYDWDIPRDRITWSRTHEELWGFKPGEFRGTYQEFADRVHPADLPGVNAEVERCRAARERYSREFRVVWPDGTERWVLGTGEFSFGRDGAAVRMRGIVKDITDRRRLEERLRESEEKFSKAFHASPALVAITTLDGRNVEVNHAYAAFTGRSREQLLGKTVTDLEVLDAAERQKLIDLIGRGGGTVRNVEVAVRTVAGARLQFLMSSDLITLSGVTHRLATMLDITERKQREDALRESEDRFAAIFKAAPGSLVLASAANGKILEVNDRFSEITGYSREEAIGRNTAELGMWADPAARDRFLARLHTDGAVVNMEADLKHRSGAIRNGLISGQLIEIHGETYLAGSFLDITVQKQAEAALRASAERLSFVVRGTETGLWDWDLRTNQVDYSREWKQLLGYQDHEVADHLDEWRRLTHPEDVEPALSKVRVYLQNPSGTLETEFRMRHANGQYRWIQSRATALLGTDGKPARLLGLHLAIDDRKRMEEALTASHQRLLSFVEHAPVAIAMFDRDMRYLVCSRRWAEDLAGAAPEDLVGRWHYEVFPGLPEHWKAAHAQGLAGQTVRHDDDPFVNEDGTMQWYRWAVLPWVNDGGGVGGIIIFTENVTARKRAEEELRNLSRRLMESQDTSRRELARELHDRIGQNLTALSLNLSIIKAQIPSERPETVPARLADSLSLVAATMDRVRNLMADLRPPALDDYGLAAALRWYGKLFFERSGVAVRVVGGAAPLRLPPTIETALFRIAEEAMTNVGRHAAAREVVITLAETAAEVRLTIADDGQGFNMASLRGSASWGMASMRERAEAIGAHCEVESAPGRGTTVTVRMARP